MNVELLADEAVHLDGSAVEPRQIGDERQADAAAFVGARTRAAHAMKAIEEMRDLFGRNSRAGVGHRQHRVVVHVAQRDRDRPVEGELEGVRQQVEDDLLPHVDVDVGRLGRRWARNFVAHPGGLDRRAKAARQIRGQLGEVDGAIGSVRASGLGAREGEQVVDQLEEAERIAVHRRERVVLEPALVLERVLDGAEHQRQRRAELVADVAEELGLLAIELGELRGPLGLLFERARAGDAGDDLPSEELQEAARFVVEEVTRIEPGHEHVRGVAVGLAGEREHERAPCRLVRRSAGQTRESGREVVDEPLLFVTSRGKQRPAARVVRGRFDRRGRKVAFDARARDQVGALAPQLVEE